MEKTGAGLDLHPWTEIAPQFDGDPRQERNVVDSYFRGSQTTKSPTGEDPSGF
jgi:hypothetical protein